MEEALVDIGLTSNEAKIYWVLLQQGPLCVRVLARESKLYRSCVYDALDHLLKKGLVSFFEKNKIRHFDALEPDSLMSWFQEKECQLESLIPKLKLERELKKEPMSKTCISEGIKAFRVMMYELLDKQSQILVYGIPASVPSIVRYFINVYHKDRIARRIWMKHIYNQDALERICYLNRLPFTEAKFLPEEFSSPVSTLICKDEVVLISWEPLTMIRIKNEKLALAYQKYFEILWEKARKRKNNEIR